MGNVATKVSLGRMTFTFTDENDEVFSSFRMNPTDVNLAKRCEEVVAKYSNREDKALTTVSEVTAYGAELEEQICYILGYDARETAFGEVPALTLLPDGKLFGLLVLETIEEKVKPVIAERAKAMAASIQKYTAKYE